MSDVLSTEEFLMFTGLSLIGLGCDFNILPSLARRELQVHGPCQHTAETGSVKLQVHRPTALS